MIPGAAAGDPKLWAAAASAVVVLNRSASVAFAAEITGKGTLKDVNGRSFCAYSGQEGPQWYTDDTDTTLPANRRGALPRGVCRNRGAASWAFCLG